MTNIKLPSLSIQRPWIDRILCGKKTIETRTWKTDYRGPLLLHAPKKLSDDMELETMNAYFGPKPLGSILGIANIIDIKPYDIKRDSSAAMLFYYGDGMYSWFFEDIQLIQPIRFKGRQGLFWLSVPEALLNPMGRIEHDLTNIGIYRFINAGKEIKNITKPKES